MTEMKIIMKMTKKEITNEEKGESDDDAAADGRWLPQFTQPPSQTLLGRSMNETGCHLSNKRSRRRCLLNKACINYTNKTIVKD